MEPDGTGESVRKGIAERAKDPPGQLEIPDRPDTIDGATQTDSLHRPEPTETNGPGHGFCSHRTSVAVADCTSASKSERDGPCQS